MTPTREFILEKFTALITRGQEVLSNCETSLTGEPTPRSEDYFSFRTQALSLVRRSCGEHSDHYRELQRLATDTQSANSSSFLPHCLGVVQAAKDDFEFGLLFDLRLQISADCLEGILQQAERRLQNGHPEAAALLAGAGLEEMLKRLLASYPEATHDSPPTDLAALNVSLAKADAYNRHVEARVTALVETTQRVTSERSEVPSGDEVREMIDSVRKFAADHLR